MESNNKRVRVAVFAGARSTEHEVSLISAYNIVNAIDQSSYEVFVVGIDKQGVWRQYAWNNFVDNPSDIRSIKLVNNPISGRLAVTQSSGKFYDIDNGGNAVFECDVVFPAVLGNYAEDGTMQGLLRMMNVPFTTPDVLGSAVGMDKDVSYRLLRDAGIDVAEFITLRKHENLIDYDEAVKRLNNNILFVKPANAGSSVGVSKVTNPEEYMDAINLAFQYDVKVIVQSAVFGREIEVGVIGNIGNQKVSVAGEIVEKNSDDFYSYENKYVHSDNVVLQAPADLTEDLYSQIQEKAIQTCQVLECEGFGRVDFFVANDVVYVNEINTMPGFTAISMFPRLWGESGLVYTQLIDELLKNAQRRFDYRIAPIITDAADVIEAANHARERSSSD